MIQQKARVIACGANTVDLIAQNTSACHSCSAQSGCGTGLLAQLFPQRLPRNLQLPRHLFPDNLGVADSVLLGISENALQTATWLVYLVPLLGLIVGSLLGALFAEYLSILSGLLGLVLGSFLVSRHNTVKNLSIEQLKVLRVDSTTAIVSMPTQQ